MRKMLLLASVVAALATVAPAHGATITVAINRAGFTPNPARVDVGDTVTWTNSDTRNRQVISKAADFASPILKPGETFSFTFKKEGRFAYEETLVEPTQKGTVIVSGPAAPPPAPGTLTLAASSTTVVFGGKVSLTGELSSGATGETIEVLSAPSVTTALAAMTKVSETTTTSGGEFHVAVKPTIKTVYRVRWKQTTSGRVTINVRPRIGLGIVSVARGIFTTRANSEQDYTGHTVLFQRRASFGQWITLKRVRLGNFGRAQFRARLPRGVSRVRVFMTATQAGPGYLAGISPTRLVRR